MLGNLGDAEEREISLILPSDMLHALHSEGPTAAWIYLENDRNPNL